MQTYLTTVWKLGFTRAAGIMNVWGGINMILPIAFLFLVDAFLGHYLMLLLSTAAYSVGMGFLSMSTPPVLATQNCKRSVPECIGDRQKVLFYVGMAFLSVGVSGHLVSLQPFLKMNMEEENNGGKKDLLTLPGVLTVVIMPITGGIALPYIKPWSLRFGIPAICTTVAMILFLSGTRKYKKPKPEGSPLANICRVFVASASKIFRLRPLDANGFYRGEADSEHQSFPLTHTLRCLDKAAIILPDKDPEEQKKNKWTLCTIKEVEEAKTLVRMIPIWTTFIICGVISSIGNTYFLEQAKNMNRNLGKLKVPTQILLILFNTAKEAFALSKCKYPLPIGTSVAMVFSVLCCITAARVEIQRLNVIRSHGLLDQPEAEIPMSMFWLVFQFVLLAGLDKFFEDSSSAFLETQVPKSMESMKTYLGYFNRGVRGLGVTGGVLSVYVVGKVSETGGRKNWFQYTLNKSRLDRYYWVLGALSTVNLLVHILIAFTYNFKPASKPENDDKPASKLEDDES